MGSFRFARDTKGILCSVSGTQPAILEVLDVPDDYASAEVSAIVVAVYEAGILSTPSDESLRTLRITWAALVEKGIASGILTEEDA